MPAQLKRRLTVFLVAVGLIALAFFLHWWFIGRHVESTDNATSRRDHAGGQPVGRAGRGSPGARQPARGQGQLLVRLEDADFKLAVERAQAALATREAELAQARSKLVQQGSLIAASAADVNASQATLGRAQIDLNRAEALRKPGYVSEERVTTLTADNHVARSQLAKARADLEAQRVQRDTLGAEIKRLEAQIASARTELAQAEINLSRTLIHSPINGLVGQRSARNGQYVQVGTHLLSLVPDEDIWVQANFKETRSAACATGRRRA